MSDATTRICPSCGTKRPVNATTCPKCGAPVAAAEPVTSRSRPGMADPGSDPVGATASPPRKPSVFRTAWARIRGLDALGALRRLIALAALVVILLALAYALLPFKTARASCSPAVVQVFDRQRLTPPTVPGGPPGPPITAPATPPAGATSVATPSGVLKPCTQAAKRRLYYAGPIVLLALIASFGARRILS